MNLMRCATHRNTARVPLFVRPRADAVRKDTRIQASLRKLTSLQVSQRSTLQRSTAGIPWQQLLAVRGNTPQAKVLPHEPNVKNTSASNYLVVCMLMPVYPVATRMPDGKAGWTSCLLSIGQVLGCRKLCRSWHHMPRFSAGKGTNQKKHSRLRSSLFLASATEFTSSTRQQARYTEPIATSTPTLQECWLTSPVAVTIPKHRLPFCLQIPVTCGSNSARPAHIWKFTATTLQFCKTSSLFYMHNVENAPFLRDFLNVRPWQCLKRRNSARLPSKMESSVQSWRPRNNAFCDFSTPSV